jgi:hypothetical protein
MPEQFQNRWKLLDTVSITDPATKLFAHRLNCLGSLYYFIKVGLRRHRLQDTLHKLMADSVEKEHLKEVHEWPRDHFKTTIYSEGAPMWWALPFTSKDEAYMRALGYDDEWIRWMRSVHDQDTRTLIVSSNIDNAIKIGRRVGHHYENNDFFRELFPEIIPDSSCVWSDKCRTQKRTKASPDGEGTFDFLGVGAALQSRHYKRVIQDDLVGRDAIDSPVVMADIISYHQLLVGAWDSDPTLVNSENDEIVVGNRWSMKDLNAWIVENETWFHTATHSALGGCCALHPAGVPLFSAEYTKEKLEKIAVRLGLYYFSCQYLNNPIAPGSSTFDASWLSYYAARTVSLTDRRMILEHEVVEGVTIKDVMPANLRIIMIVDPNHAENKGRCRHAVSVLGYYKQKLDGKTDERMYLLDSWAESCTYEKLVAKIYELAAYWRLTEFWLETVAAQKILKFYLEYRNRIEGHVLKVNELKIDYSPNAKVRRIEGLNPWFAEHRFFTQRRFKDFAMEYKSFPYGKTLDILDTVAYAPQVFDSVGVTPKQEIKVWLEQNKQNNPILNVGVAGY